MQRILNISEATSIAIHSAVAIAQSEHKMNALQIANRTSFSKNHIAKVLQQLVKNGIISSERGPNGGFQLAKKPKDIRLMDVYRVMNGELKPSECCHAKAESCPFGKCVFGGISNKFTQEFKDYLNSKTLSDLI